MEKIKAILIKILYPLAILAKPYIKKYLLETVFPKIETASDDVKKIILDHIESL